MRRIDKIIVTPIISDYNEDGVLVGECKGQATIAYRALGDDIWAEVERANHELAGALK